MKKLLFVFLTYTALAQDSPSRSIRVHNNTAEYVKLFIPGVMNPNLIPYSESQITLPVGQKVYWTQDRKSKRILILEVKSTWPSDTQIYMKETLENFRIKK